MAVDQDCSVRVPYVERRLAEFHRLWRPLSGLSNRGGLQKFVDLLADAAEASQRIGELTDDPILAEILNYQQRSATDEACWLLFLYCYIGRSGLLDAIHRSWSWEKASADADAFGRWLTVNQRELKNAGSLSAVHKYRAFDQHRAKAMGEDAKGHISWIKAAGSHEKLFQSTAVQSQGQPTKAFDKLYISMNEHTGFKRQIQFEYLCLIGDLKIAGIEPGQFYFSDILPLKKAARQLFGGNQSAKIPVFQLNELTVALVGCLGNPFSITVLYRALMDWGEEKIVAVNPNFRRY